jgi:hypothetical protein
VSSSESHHWTFTIATPAGDVHARYRVSLEALDFESDAIWNGGHVSVPWSAIVAAGTTTLAMPIGPGVPDLGRYVPRQLEWLVASRSDKTRKPFMGPLPPGSERETLIASVRERLGVRWTGEGIPLAEAQQRFGLPSDGEPFKAAAIVVGVLALLALLLVVLVLLLTPVVLIPASFLLAAWLAHTGLSGLRDAGSITNTPNARIGAAGIGLVAIEGRAVSAQASPAAVSGRPSVWWDVGLDGWSAPQGSHEGGDWRQLAARHGGTIDVLDVEDHTGRVSVWLKDATLVLATQTWEAEREALPPAAVALMRELGFPWKGRLRLRETRLEVDAPVYVLGTLDQRRAIPEPGEEGPIARTTRAFRTGEWRRQLLRVLPQALRVVVATLFGFLSIVLGVGRGGERTQGPQDSSPPDLPGHALLIWKGLAGRPFVVSNGPAPDVIAQLRTRSLLRGAGGAGVAFYGVYELFQLLF